MCACSKIFREPVNTITHMAGALGSVAALTLMIVFAAFRADAWHIVSFSIFGSSLILMYTASFLYHGLRISDKGLGILRRIDHIMIFMVIAGSYTPLCLVPLRGPWGWSLFGTVWGIALAGIVLKICCMNVPRWISTLIYLTMGWLCVIAVFPLVRTLEPGGLAWLAAGGLFYSGGALVYALKKPNLFRGLFGFHEIWHLFVLLGSACHFWLAFRYLMYVA
ncbi:PAQR family membrane homeostasis protein TrhA [Desulfospira joergensenii]|uniref:PAQR family membrane homeostasis protein TrhA n=1 Tax=Desulfospira joergensenii TaxID=53329 RepID=UPI0003B6A5E1|nr:hemolysin III family protein [Desulfospira joergensenii]